MSLRDFSSDVSRARLERAIVKAESTTGAEVVIAVRRAASRHHLTSVFAGLVVTLVFFVWWWFTPTPFDIRLLPIELVVVFGFVALGVGSIDPVRRWLTPRARLDRALDAEATKAFATLGVEKTRERVGVLVVAALFEHDARIVPDIGIDLGSLGAPVLAIERALREAVAAGDVERFASHVEALGTLLGEKYPRAEDDQNELSDFIR